MNTADYGEDLHPQICLWKTVKWVIHKVVINGLGMSMVLAQRDEHQAELISTFIVHLFIAE